jgi:uncharacterized protein (TIGR01777 family)
MRVFITGGTGLIGGRLVEHLLARGDIPILLTRRPDSARKRWGERCTVIVGDPTQPGEWMPSVRECDAVVNLAGENLFGHRWNATFKETLRSSRIQATANVVQALAREPRRADGTPKVLVNGSAIGIYGPQADAELDETSPPAADFLAQLCRDWENAAEAATGAGVRVVCLRTGIVLAADGGALPQMLPPFRMFVGGPVGSGRQFMSWIHQEDESGLILHALDNMHASGAVNATAPQPVTNRDFSRTLGRVLHRPSFLPMPAFALRVLIGEAAYVISTGQRVLPTRALQLGYVFKFPGLESTLRDLLGRPAPAAAA